MINLESHISFRHGHAFMLLFNPSFYSLSHSQILSLGQNFSLHTLLSEPKVFQIAPILGQFSESIVIWYYMTYGFYTFRPNFSLGTHLGQKIPQPITPNSQNANQILWIISHLTNAITYEFHHRLQLLIFFLTKI